MVSITIKGLKDGCHIYAFYDDFQAFIKEFKQRKKDSVGKENDYEFKYQKELNLNLVKYLF